MKRRLIFAAMLLSARSATSQTTPHPAGTAHVYKVVGSRSLSLDVMQPSDTTNVHPAVLFFHGGGWTEGSPASFDTQSAALASHGVVGITVEYRLLAKDSTESPRVCVEDAGSAMRWVRAHAAELRVDPHRIGAAGGSAGGYMAAYLANGPGWADPSDDQTISAKPNALLLFNPVLDNSENGFGAKRFGNEAALRSPLSHVSHDLPPMLIQSGADDKLIHASVLRAYQHDVLGSGVQCDLIIYDGQAHGFFNREPFLTQTTEKMLQFLQHLGWTLPTTSDAKRPAGS